MITRRSLLKRIGAVAALAPVFASTGTNPPAAAMPDVNTSVVDERGYQDGYAKGLERGLQATVEQWVDIEYLERRTVAHIDDKYVAVAEPL